MNTETSIGESQEIATPQSQEASQGVEVATPESTPEPQPDTAEKQDGNASRNVQRRIDRLTREKYELRAELNQLRKQFEASQPKPEPPQAPKLENFQNIEEYITAQTRFNTEHAAGRIRDEFAQQQRAMAAQQDEMRVRDSWGKALEHAREAYPDFDEVVDSPVEVSKAMQDAILRAPNGADIAYYLGKHPQEAERIAALDPFSALVEMGRLSATVTRPKPKAATTAPAPISPVGTAAKAESDPDKMSTQEWLRWRNAQLKAQGRR